MYNVIKNQTPNDNNIEYFASHNLNLILHLGMQDVHLTF